MKNFHGVFCFTLYCPSGMHVKNSEFQIAALGPEKSSNVSDVCRARACYLNSNVGVKKNNGQRRSPLGAYGGVETGSSERKGT